MFFRYPSTGLPGSRSGFFHFGGHQHCKLWLMAQGVMLSRLRALLHWVTEVELGHPPYPLPLLPPPSCAAKQLHCVLLSSCKYCCTRSLRLTCEGRGKGVGLCPTGIHLPGIHLSMPAQNQPNAHSSSPRAAQSRSAAVTLPVTQHDLVAAFTGIAGSGAALMLLWDCFVLDND
jgi:hypothetical protein